jgi:hypothetical protein
LNPASGKGQLHHNVGFGYGDDIAPVRPPAHDPQFACCLMPLLAEDYAPGNTRIPEARVEFIDEHAP